MKQLTSYGDSRQTGFCAYCGSHTETRDHVPPRIFLDEPYPANLPVVPACQSCNIGFSLDEEYVACLIECVLSGSENPKVVSREKIRRTLLRKPALVSRFRQARQVESGDILFNVESDRVMHIVLKLARGHAAFELNEPQLNDPSWLFCTPLSSLPPEDRDEFEAPLRSLISPEVGSRAMQRMVINRIGAAMWINVQHENYRYLAGLNQGAIIRMVIREHLACEVAWNDTW